MLMSVLTRLRRFWLDVHLWIGVAAFIPFVILGITGSVLVFHHELEHWVAPHRYELSAGAPLPLAAQIERARTALPDGFVVSAVRPPEDSGSPVLVQARATARPADGQRPDTRTIYLDPASGRVLDVANPRAEAFGIMHVLHGSLMIPENGRKVVGWLGWFMLISSLTGIWLWWPRGRSFWRGFRWSRSPRTTTNLHHLAGFWIAIPLAIISFTGVYISFPQMSRAVLGALTGAPSAAARPPGGGGPGGGPPPIENPNLTADAAAAAALAAAPDGHLIAVNLPTPGRDGAAPAWRVQLKLPNAEANSNISVNDLTGEAEARGGAAPAADQNAARLMRRLHDGTDFGMVWRVIVALTGLAPAVLGVTGIVMWLRRRAARRAIRRGIRTHASQTTQ